MTSTTDQPKEAQMFNKKIRTMLVSTVAAGALAVVAIVPAVSQAQWHTICSAGHCTTHKNFTIGGKSPCENIKENLNNAHDGLLNSIDTRPLRIGGPSVTQVEAERRAEIEREEARVREAERASFEWGCQVPA
jgi:hypothetical protein